MFDIAYEAEATIEAAKILKEKTWNNLLKKDLSKPFTGFVKMLEITRYIDIIDYWSIMLETHGT